ncbi:MAG: terminase small subunit [Betaproteobacteria bacterium]|nr:terminase small subunit [Betaproteobacteria bacterium]
MPELTAKQQRFLDEYGVDGNGTRAAVAAGYGRAGASVAAHRLLRNPKARAVIEARQGVDSQRLQISRQDVLTGLVEAFAMAKEKREPAAMVSAARELGRLMGFYEPQRHAVEVTAGADAEMGRYERMSDEELLRLVGSAAATS